MKQPHRVASVGLSSLHSYQRESEGHVGVLKRYRLRIGAIRTLPLLVSLNQFMRVTRTRFTGYTFQSLEYSVRILNRLGSSIHSHNRIGHRSQIRAERHSRIVRRSHNL